MSPGLQVKLLRVLQDHIFRRSGHGRYRGRHPCHRRHQQGAGQLIRTGAFRRTCITGLTSSRSRCRRCASVVRTSLSSPPASSTSSPPARAGTPCASTPEAMDALLAHTWPGNVRELENVMERAVALRRVTRCERRNLRPTGATGSPASRLKLAGAPGGLDLEKIVAERSRP